MVTERRILSNFAQLKPPKGGRILSFQACFGDFASLLDYGTWNFNCKNHDK
jgi:hypothetical protein